MAALTRIEPSVPTPTGVEVTQYNDTASGDPIVLTASQAIAIENNGNVYIRTRRTGTSAITMTVTTTKTLGGLDLEDYALALSTDNGSVQEFGPFATDLVNDADGDMTVTFSAVGDVDVSVVRRG